MKVWVNGTFDVLHIGHIRLLEFASQFGDVTVGVDTDDRIKIKKGLNRPFNKLNERIEFLNSIKFVKNVLSFGTDEELENHIKNFQPDYMIIGDDYKNKPIIGSSYIPKIIYYPVIKDKSTSKILSYENNCNR